jgi:hypothetical protein
VPSSGPQISGVLDGFWTNLRASTPRRSGNKSLDQFDRSVERPDVSTAIRPGKSRPTSSCAFMASGPDVSKATYSDMSDAS